MTVLISIAAILAMAEGDQMDHRFLELGLTPRYTEGILLQNTDKARYSSRYRKPGAIGMLTIEVAESLRKAKQLFHGELHQNSTSWAQGTYSEIPIGDLAGRPPSQPENTQVAGVTAALETFFCSATFVFMQEPSVPARIEAEYTCRRVLGQLAGYHLRSRNSVSVSGSNLEAMTYKDGATYVRLSDWFIARNAAGVSNGWHGSIVSARVGSKDIKVAGAAKGLQINGQWKTLSNPVLYRDSAWWVPLAGFQALVP